MVKEDELITNTIAAIIVLPLLLAGAITVIALNIIFAPFIVIEKLVDNQNVIDPLDKKTLNNGGNNISKKKKKISKKRYKKNKNK